MFFIAGKQSAGKKRAEIVQIKKDNKITISYSRVNKLCEITEGDFIIYENLLFFILYLFICSSQH